MRLFATSGVLALAVLFLATTSRAEVAELADAPYASIVDRNAFGLRPVPVAPPVQDTNPPPVKVDLKLTGITKTSRGKKAWLMIPAQPGKNPEPEYLSLLEGQTDGDVEVMEIDQEGRTVKVKNAGTIVMLNFKDHGASPPAGAILPPPPVARGVQPNPAVTARGAVRTAPMQTSLPQPSVRSTPRGYAGRGNMDAPMMARYGLQAQGAATYQGTPSVRTIPARNVRTTPAPPQEQIDPVIQAIQMKAHEQQARMEGRSYPPLPPIPGLDP